MQTLSKLSHEIAEWAVKNQLVPDSQDHSSRPFLGMVEEIGELAHARLKREQGIRGMDDITAFCEAERDAVADLLIYTLHYCSLRRIDPDKLLRDTWETVKKRNWTENKETGVV